MRITFIGQQIEAAGTELQFLALARELAANGHDVRVLSFKNPGPNTASAVEAFTQAGGRLEVLANESDSVQGLRFTWRLRRILTSNEPDVVHAMSSRAMVAVAILRHCPGWPATVMSRRSLVSDRDDRWLKRLLRIWAIRSGDLIIANSEQVAVVSSRFEGVPARRYAVIPNILGDEAFAEVAAAIDRANPSLISVANLREPKNHLGLLEAIAVLQSSGHEVDLILVGDGELRAEIECRSKQLAIRVRLVGAVADPRPYLAGSDIFVQASSSEGMSNSLLEAMAAGLAVVATDVGGTREALNGAGSLVDPNDMSALAAAIKKLLDDPDLRRAMGEAARARARHFTAEKSLSRHIAAYRLAIQNRSSRELD